MDADTQRRIVSVLYWGFVGMTAILAFPVAVAIWIVTTPFDRRRVLLHRFTCLWASLYTWLSPGWSVRVEGRERIRPDATYVMVANHQSLLDVFVMFRLFCHFKWVSKIENFKIPFVGWNMWLNGYIPLRRGHRESIVQMMQACLRTLESGSSVMMFPEGSRSPDGRLREFRPGAFDLARQAGCPILPIVVNGTSQALPKRGLILTGQHSILIRVLDEIPVESFAADSTEALTQRVRDRIARELGELQSPPTQQASG